MKPELNIYDEKLVKSHSFYDKYFHTKCGCVENLVFHRMPSHHEGYIHLGVKYYSQADFRASRREIVSVCLGAHFNLI